MSRATLHLRSETKPFEERSFLTPKTAKALIEAGYTVNVEHSPMRCFEDVEFEAVGASLVPEGSWPTVPLEHIILGLKELLVEETPLSHTHVLFAHVFKDQEGWKDVLTRYHKGGGTLLDIEFLQDPQGKLLAPSGFHAGYCGAALAVKAWGHQLVYPSTPLGKASSFASDASLIADVKGYYMLGVAVSQRLPRVIVMGGRGRCGQGAISLLQKVGIPAANILSWGRAETSRDGGPFPEVLESDILINCIYLDGKVPPFVTMESLERPGRRLRVISDVSCDNTDPNNPIAVYTEHTSFEEPTLRIKTQSKTPLDIIAIDHLPSLLPREASESCSQDLLPSLLHLADWQTAASWKMGLELFKEKLALAIAAVEVAEATLAPASISLPQRPGFERTLSGKSWDFIRVVKNNVPAYSGAGRVM